MAESESALSFSGGELNEGSEAVTDKEKPRRLSIIQYSDPKRKKALIKFSSQNIFTSLPLDERISAAKWHLSYKFVKTECKIVRTILHQHCFQEVHPNSSEFNLMWTGSHLRPHTLRGMREFQKINHFPRSYELTRKDKLYQNIQKMQNSKGFRNFDFIPEAYIVPAEYNNFGASFSRQRGLWIVKPVASSRGRGIYLINHPNQIPLEDTLLVSKYIANPLLVDGFKFDLRLYIGVTSFDPLRIYLYEEGLTRFATVKYDQSNKNIRNSCMHLTNYSVNKKNDDYVSCNDPNIEDYGNKWSFGALLRFLRNKSIDTTSLVSRIEDLIIKTILSGELPIATACKMFMPHQGNCFEIYGFDVLLDDNLKPWLLEVNLSPSMACDSPMDLKIKSNLLIDMFNMTGFLAHDPLLKKVTTKPTAGPYVRNIYQRQRCQSAGSVMSKELSGGCGNIPSKNQQFLADSERGLTADELRVLKETREEYLRRGNFVRIFPAPNSRELYGKFLEYRTTNNRMLFARLFVERMIHDSTQDKNNSTKVNKAHSTYLYGQTLEERMRCYERQLPSMDAERQQMSQAENPMHKPEAKYQGLQNISLIQGQLEVRSDHIISLDQSTITNSATTSGPVKAAFPHPQPLNTQIKYVIQRAGSISKLQARKAFGMYLRRVKQRLVQEVSCDYDDSGDEDEKAKQDEQMNLVIRFLKRAAKNLRQEFKVVVPSHKLPMQDRRRMLAQQLGEFVHIYDKETAQIKEKAKENMENPKGSLSNEEFQHFLATASENELEEMLTVYTRVNNNTSIFLGKATIKPNSTPTMYKPPLQRETETRKHVRSHSAHAFSSSTREEARKQKPDLQPQMSEKSRRIAGAVAAYGKSLSQNLTKKRPASANFSTQRRPLAATARPVSAKVSRDKPFIAAFDAIPAMTTETSVSDALKIIAKRQAVRQYAARPAIFKDETNKWVQPSTIGDISRTKVDKHRIAIDRPGSHISVPSQDDESQVYSKRPDSRVDSRYNNADDTFHSFVNHELQITQISGHTKPAYKERQSDRAPSTSDRPPSTKGNDDVIRADAIRIPYGAEHDDCSKGEKRSAVVREEYNKHMQLLIERLAAHKFDKTPAEVVPKPPPRPRTASAKRPVSAKRMSRITTSHNNFF